METGSVPLNRLPVYNIKAVSRLVGLLPVTLRAWERRYGMPSPQRGGQGYRLYSEHDLRTLRWLKNQLDAGLSISRAVDYLQELRSSGSDPVDSPQSGTVTPTPGAAATLAAAAGELAEALRQFQEVEAGEILRRAFALYSVDQVLVEVVQPALVAIGEAWHRGELPVAVEHYATQYCMQHLNSMLAASPPPGRAGTIVAACAPGEMHQIGILTLVVMLRWRGWDVKYLGPDLLLERLEEALGPLRPRMLLFTATRREAADRLAELAGILKDFPEPQPLVVLGGRAFDGFHLPQEVPAVYLNAAPSETVAMLEDLLYSGEVRP